MCVTISCRKPDHSTRPSKRGRRGSGEEEKCSVAVLVFPCDAWAFRMSDVVMQEEQDGMAGGRASVLSGPVCVCVCAHPCCDDSA